MSKSNIEMVKELYEAFGRRDIDFILDHLADTICWASHFDSVVPWAGKISGKAGVPRFFDLLFQSLEVESFEPTEWIAQEDSVVSIGDFAFRNKATGRKARSRWVFVWRFSNGKVNSFEQFHDAELANSFR